MIFKTFLIFSLIFGVILCQKIQKNSNENELESDVSQKIEDLNAAESGLIVDKKKEDIIAGKVAKKENVGFKADKKVLDISGKKFNKKKILKIGKKFESKGFKGSKKEGVFGKSGKKFKKFNEKKGLKKIAAAGYKKKYTSVKTFGESKGFKFGKIGGFKVAKGLAKGFGKKGKKFNAVELNGFKKNIKTGKKKLLKSDDFKGNKKIFDVKKSGFKKGGTVSGGKVLKVLKVKKLKKIY